jgi:immune inhibitor A
MNPTSRFLPGCIIALIVAILIMICCLFVFLGYKAVTKNFQQLSAIFQSASATSQTSTPFIPMLTKQPVNPSPQGEVNETLIAIQNAVIPPADPVKTAFKLGWVKDLSRAKVDPPKIYYEGDTETFWVLNQESNRILTKTATLRKSTPHVYFWVEQGRVFNKPDLYALADTFENEIYPKTRSFFGSEWTPGVDNDGHIFILYTDDLGESIAGVFSAEDSIPTEVNPNSNGHEIFFISSSERLSDPYTYGVLAHEFNHMILWFQDKNEDTWVAEGLADLASMINGYDTGGFDGIFALAPDIQLNTWPEDPDAQDAHYGSSFLFFAYLYSRFGEDAIRELMRIPGNGFEGIDSLLKSLGAIDPVTGQPLTANQVFGDWTVTNFINDPSVGAGQYSYSMDYPIPPFTNTEFPGCPMEWQERTVNQFGTDYIELKCNGKFNLEFQGSPNVRILSAPILDNDHAYWSNRADSSETTLTKDFDFSDITDPFEMTYRIWYDLEDGYDYTYLSALDETGHWKILETLSCTTTNPIGANLGCGYTGKSGSWVDEKVDLSEFSGKKVTLQLLSITDSAVNNEGTLIDDVSIPAIKYFADFENNDGGWFPEGWVRIENELPQTYELSIIQPGENPVVKRIASRGNELVDFDIDFNSVDSIELIVTGTTRFVTTPANYQFRFVPLP